MTSSSADAAPGGIPLSRVITALEAAYPPEGAIERDAVGLVCGDPDARVRTVLLAVDPVADTVAEAVETGADLLVAHRPLDAGAVPAGTSAGRLVHRLATGGAALYVAHSNAETAAPGVSDALAELLGLRAVRPLLPVGERLDKVVTSVPHEAVDDVIDAMAAAGAGTIGEYRRCAWTATGLGTFVPQGAARPVIGKVGRAETVPETRVEMVLPRDRRAAVVAALIGAHPYEEPPHYLCELAELPGPRGRGRVGELPTPIPLADFVARVAGRLPQTPAGVRAAGDPARPIRTVAVHGGAAGELLAEAARIGVDAFLAGDIRHRDAAEARERGGPALVDVGPWAAGRPWLTAAAARLKRDLAGAVSVRVSDAVTDPWSLSG